MIAKERGLDPSLPDSWYSLTRKIIMQYKVNYYNINIINNNIDVVVIILIIMIKGASRVLAYYKGSATSALIDLFPHLHLIATKFEQVPRIIINHINSSL